MDRIAQSMRQPNLSQSTLCSAASSMLPPSNGGQGRNSLDNGQIINAFSNSSSPAHSPNCPPGAIDIEVEVGDHEVDTMFRDPGPKPLIVARATPPLQVCIRFEDGEFPMSLVDACVMVKNVLTTTTLLLCLAATQTGICCQLWHVVCVYASKQIWGPS